MSAREKSSETKKSHKSSDDLTLSGSQINLNVRQLRTNPHTLISSAIHNKRPVSAMSDRTNAKRSVKTGSWSRPQSADYAKHLQRHKTNDDEFVNTDRSTFSFKNDLTKTSSELLNSLLTESIPSKWITQQPSEKSRTFKANDVQSASSSIISEDIERLEDSESSETSLGRAISSIEEKKDGNTEVNESRLIDLSDGKDGFGEIINDKVNRSRVGSGLKKVEPIIVHRADRTRSAPIGPLETNQSRRPPVSMSREYQQKFFSSTESLPVVSTTTTEVLKILPSKIRKDSFKPEQPPKKPTFEPTKPIVEDEATKTVDEDEATKTVDEVDDESDHVNEYLKFKLADNITETFDQMKKYHNDYQKLLRFDQFNQLDCLNEEENENSLVDDEKNNQVPKPIEPRRRSLPKIYKPEVPNQNWLVTGLAENEPTLVEEVQDTARQSKNDKTNENEPKDLIELHLPLDLTTNQNVNEKSIKSPENFSLERYDRNLQRDFRCLFTPETSPKRNVNEKKVIDDQNESKSSVEINESPKIMRDKTKTSPVRTKSNKSKTKLLKPGKSHKEMNDSNSSLVERSKDTDGKVELKRPVRFQDECNESGDGIEKNPFVVKKRPSSGGLFKRNEESDSDVSSRVRDIKNAISGMPASTYEDIMSILHVLDQDSSRSLSSEDVGYSSSNNLHEILSYLDEVDKTSSSMMNPSTTYIQNASRSGKNKIKGCLPTLDELLRMNPIDLAHEVLGLRLQLEEKLSSVRLLQETLDEQRNSAQKSVKTVEIEYKRKMKTQKDEYEAVVKRHQKFIDQLINDKKSLSEQCEKLVEEMKTAEEKHLSAFKAAEHRHTVELQRVKDMCAAGEKIRREKWIEGKTQKIKEMTVKGIEPELNQLQSRHQQELSDLRLIHKQEIEELEMRAARKTQQQLELLKEQMTNEREQAIAKERDILRERFEKQTESEEKNYQELKRRLNADIARTKERLEEEYAARFSECEKREQLVARDKQRALDLVRSEYEDRINELTRKHKAEIQTLKDNVEIESETWKSQFKKEQKTWIAEMEKEIREQCRDEYERELQNALANIRMESNELKKQMESLTDNRIKRLNDKYEQEIRELERSEKQTMDKYVEMKKKAMQSDEMIVGLQNRLRVLETQLGVESEEKTKLLQERGDVKTLVRKELQAEIDMIEKELIKMKEDHEKELKQIHTRVKLAISRKDESIQSLTKDILTTKDRCSFLEQLLEQQRREYLIKK